tara:strand:- start:160 stop:603 length:444 start_codon:yes stop_codon:yes gene_type:complete
MLFYLLSDKDIPEGSFLRIPENIVLFQEFESAIEQNEIERSAEVYKIILDIKIHDPLVFEQSRHIYKPMQNGRFADYSAKRGIMKFEFFEKITDICSSRDIFQTAALLQQIKDFGFDAVFVFENYKREVITLKECFGKVIGTTTDEK